MGPGGLPYRPCAGVVLIDDRGLVFAGRRIDRSPDQPPAWQMPQGGIDEGETPREAALRELTEETGIDPSLVEVLDETPHWVFYDLPPEMVGRIWKGRYGGQCQKWLALRFLGQDTDIRIDTAHPEFDQWRWAGVSELQAIVAPFKREVYRTIVEGFSPLLK